ADQLNAMFDGTAVELRKELPIISDEHVLEAKSVFTSNDPRKFAIAALGAAAHKVAIEKLDAANKEIVALKANIDGMKAKTPEVKGGGTTAPEGGSGIRPAESLAERTARLAQEGGFVK